MRSNNLQITLKIYVSSILLFLICCSFADFQSANGKLLYESKCQRCHGKEGTKALFGIKSLQKSKLEDFDVVRIIQDGKKIMPGYKTKITPEELKQLAIYVKTLRK